MIDDDSERKLETFSESVASPFALLLLTSRNK